MPLDPLAEQGFGAALAYERGRPSYAPEAVRELAADLGLSGSSRLLDLAAGTGQLSRLFAPLVGSVVAVEPSEPMRCVMAQQLPAVEVLAGEAERLPLDDSSVDAIVVGTAFHWFSGDDAVDEMARVLRPRGALGLLWNMPVAIDPPWPEEVDTLVQEYRTSTVPDERRYESGMWRRAFEHSSLFEPLSSGHAQHDQRLDPETFVAQIASWSYIAALPEPTRDAVLDRVRELAPLACLMTHRTDFYWTRKR